MKWNSQEFKRSILSVIISNWGSPNHQYVTIVLTWYVDELETVIGTGEHIGSNWIYCGPPEKVLKVASVSAKWNILHLWSWLASDNVDLPNARVAPVWHSVGLSLPQCLGSYDDLVATKRVFLNICFQCYYGSITLKQWKRNDIRPMYQDPIARVSLEMELWINELLSTERKYTRCKLLRLFHCVKASTWRKVFFLLPFSRAVPRKGDRRKGRKSLARSLPPLQFWAG